MLDRPSHLAVARMHGWAEAAPVGQLAQRGAGGQCDATV
jgi:hypothetical protein